MKKLFSIFTVSIFLVGCGGGQDSSGNTNYGTSNSGQPNLACINARSVLASGGGLSAIQQQQVQAYSAKLTQDAINRGGVGLNQVAAQVASFQENLIQSNINTANATIIQNC